MTNTLELIWCRTFQAVLKVGNYFMGYRMPHYLEGPGKIAELGAFLKEKKLNDVLVVDWSASPLSILKTIWQWLTYRVDTRDKVILLLD